MGEVLQRGGTVRVRPLDGGGNETQVLAPEGGRFYVSGLENGNYEAVDELGNQRVFTVTQGTGEEIDLEAYESAEAVAGEPLPANYGTEAPPVGDESHEIQHGLPPMKIEGPLLTREGSEQPSALTPSPQEDGPEGADVPGLDQGGEPPHPANPEEVAALEGDVEAGRAEELAPANLSTAHLAAVLSNDTAEFPQAGEIDRDDSIKELDRRADAGDAGAQNALEQHGIREPVEAGSDVPPADDPEHEPEQ